jgi:hypothetical protein
LADKLIKNCAKCVWMFEKLKMSRAAYPNMA